MLKLSELNVWVSATQQLLNQLKISLDKELPSLQARQIVLAPIAALCKL